METPTIVKQTKGYLIIKVPLPAPAPILPSLNAPRQQETKMSATEKRLWRTLQESERDVRAGRVITEPNITEAMRRYEKRQWD